MDVILCKPTDTTALTVTGTGIEVPKYPQTDLGVARESSADPRKSKSIEKPNNGAVATPEQSRNNQDQSQNMSEYSTLKSLLQAPSAQSAQSTSLRQAPMSLKSRWRAEVERSRERDGVAVSVATNSHENSSQIQRPTKSTGADGKDAASEIQVFPLDLSCKTSPVPTASTPEDGLRLKVQILEQSKTPAVLMNGQPQSRYLQERCDLQDEGLQQALQILDQQGSEQVGHNGKSPPGSYQSPLNSPPVSGPQIKENISVAPPKEAASFDPLFILSQVACEKLNELHSTQPDATSGTSGTSGNGFSKPKKSKSKGMVRKSKKKDKHHSKSVKEFSRDNVPSREIMTEKSKLYDGMPTTPGFNIKQGNHDVHTVYESYVSKPNGSQDSQFQTPHMSMAPQKAVQESGRFAHTNTSSSDYLELNKIQKREDTVDKLPQQSDGDTEKAAWPHTCRTCNTRFKNAAFLRIHEKIAHENKMARTDRSGDHISFVSKDDGNESRGGPKSLATGDHAGHGHFEARHVSSGGSHRTDSDQHSGGFTSIPCVLKVNRQTSTSEMSSSSVVKLDQFKDGNERRQIKYECLNSGKPHIDFRTGETKSLGDKGAHQRPKLEVDGSAYEIIKVEQEKPLHPPPSNKGYQHKFYLQISDRNQSGEGVDSMVKIEQGHSIEDDCDIKDGMLGLKRKLLEGGNPNQIRVPTSLALKFIPGESSNDPQRQPGYQHKVYLRIVDGAESSIRIKTGSSQSPNMVGSTAVKIESTFNVNERHHTNDASRPHKCHFCPKHFPSISALTAHERIHTGEKPYECRFCGRAFYHQNDRRKHERIHTGEKPYQCSICGQKFTNKGQVKIHERNHTGERPYQCRHCHKCFKSISNVNRHEKIHTGLKPYTCPVCSRGFSRREHVRTHEEICRKKMLEEDEELADDPIGDAKHPYYRKIGMQPMDGDGSMEDGLSMNPDESPRKRHHYDPGEYYADREQWSNRRTQGFRKPHLEDRYSSDEDDDRMSNEEYSPTASISSNYDNKMSPVLYNSGPPVKPDTFSSGASVTDAGTSSMAPQDAETTSHHVVMTERRQHVGDYDNNSSLSAAPVEVDDVARFTPLRPNDNRPPKERPTPNAPYKPMPNLSNPKYVGRMGRWLQSNSESCSGIPNEMPPLQFVGSGGVSRPSQKDKSRDKPVSEKLSAHIEALLPYPEERRAQPPVSPDINAKKEPRFYVCGTPQNTQHVIQQGVAKQEPSVNPVESQRVSATDNSYPQSGTPSLNYIAGSSYSQRVSATQHSISISNSMQSQSAEATENSQRKPAAESSYSQRGSDAETPVLSDTRYSQQDASIEKNIGGNTVYSQRGQPFQKYSDSQNEMKPVVTAASRGNESPPVLFLASETHEGTTKEDTEKYTLDEPPKLSGPHMDEVPPNIGGSTANAIPPLLERTGTPQSQRTATPDSTDRFSGGE